MLVFTPASSSHAATTTSLADLPAQGDVRAKRHLHASVVRTSGTGAPTGDVVFTNGATQLGPPA